MGYYKIVTLTCDGEDCAEIYEYDMSRGTDARENPRGVGFVYKNGNDYCPECK